MFCSWHASNHSGLTMKKPGSNLAASYFSPLFALAIRWVFTLVLNSLVNLSEAKTESVAYGKSQNIVCCGPTYRPPSCSTLSCSSLFLALLRPVKQMTVSLNGRLFNCGSSEATSCFFSMMLLSIRKVRTERGNEKLTFLLRSNLARRVRRQDDSGVSRCQVSLALATGS